MNWRDLECQTINPCICNSLYRHIFLINHYSLFVCCLFVWLIIKPRLILVTHTDDLGWNITSNQQGQMLVQNLNMIVSKPNVMPGQSNIIKCWILRVWGNWKINKYFGSDSISKFISYILVQFETNWQMVLH